MALNNKRQIWETFVRRPGDLKEEVEVPLVLRDLTPGPKKYRMRHVVAIVSRNPEEFSSMDILQVRTVVGVLISESLGVRIVRELPLELPGSPYRDFYKALGAAARGEG
ncbi:MAG: phenylphosphate carboxylase subunit gamma [Candidatus Binatia bacterium]